MRRATRLGRMRLPMRKRGRYYEPEDLGRDQDRRDAAIPNRRYYVYVLDTDYGHYVGHTSHVGRRLQEHQDGETASTAGSDPELAWTSGALRTRADAARFEAALKSLRDQRARRFEEITGLEPVPFESPYYAPAAEGPGWLWPVAVAAAAAFIVWLIANAV